MMEEHYELQLVPFLPTGNSCQTAVEANPQPGHQEGPIDMYTRFLHSRNRNEDTRKRLWAWFLYV